MKFSWLKLTPFFAPEGLTVSAPGSNSGNSSAIGEDESRADVDRDLDIINADDEPKPKDKSDELPPEETDEEREEREEQERLDKEAKDKKKKDKEKDKDPDEDEEEIEEVEEDLEGEDKKTVSTYSAIKKEYPELFKKHPELKDALFSSKAYREVYPSIEEAKESKEIVQAYSAISELISSGKTSEILSEIKSVGDKEYKTFVANFLPSLWAGDKDTYYALVSPVIRQGLRSVMKKGKSTGNENLVNAALVAHIELFGDKDIDKEDEPLVKAEKDDPERKKLDTEKQEFFNKRYSLMQNEVSESLTSQVKSVIKEGLDPKGTLTPYVLNKLVDDIFNEVNDKLGKHEQHQNTMQALWKKEAAAGFTGANKNRIIEACLLRARPLIPEIRQRLRNEALKGPKAVVREKPKERRVDLSSSNRSGSKPDKDKLAGKSDLDIINED